MKTDNFSIQYPLPKHLKDFNSQIQGKAVETVDLMSELISFGHIHISHPGCGPFVAAIQNTKSLEVLVVGANLVQIWNQGWAHAERVTIALAQQMLETYIFPTGEYRMLTTSQMCIACYGETLASGLTEVIASATSSDVEELTSFKEGVLPEKWTEHLEERGITYIAEVEREKGRGLLEAYGKEGVNYFNAGSSSN